MKHKTSIRRWLAALASSAVLAAGGASAGDRDKYTEMSSEELAEHLIFEAKGFDLDQETQEGGTLGDRLRQDALQKACSEIKGNPVDSATAKKVKKLARQDMAYPEDGVELGDWKEGMELSQNAFGWRVGHKFDNHSGNTTGGMCMNCHAINPDDADRSGTIGPSLVGYGKNRGRTDAVLKYTYEMIYNPHVHFPCTAMPRFGANEVLTQEKIADIMAYLLDPDSPVNQ